MSWPTQPAWNQDGCEFWGDFNTFWAAGSVWSAYVAGGLLLLVLVALYPSWRLMLLYLVSVALLLVFQQARFEGAPRHWGHFFLLFLAGNWLLRLRFPRRKYWFSTALLAGLLLVQTQSFGVATILDTREVFSGGRAAA